MESKEQFYQSLNADTWCGWDWCRKLYGYHLGNEGYLERVLARLDELNRGEVKYIYGVFVKTQIAHEIAQQRDAGKWLVDQIDKNYERQAREAKCQKKQERLTNTQVAQQILGW